MKSCYGFIVVVLCLLALSSCNYHAYFGGGYHSLESQYLDKPHFDSIPAAAWHASASATRATGYNLSFESDEEGDLNQVYEAMIYRGETYRNLAWACGVFGYYGNYRFGNQHRDVLAGAQSARKNYHGLGGKLQLAWNIPFKSVSFRPLGIDVTINREFGEYVAFTRQLGRQFSQVSVVDDPLGVNFGITTSLRYEPQPGIVAGYQVKFAIPDRDYGVIYRDGLDERQDLFDGASGILFIGTERFLFQAEFGFSPAQFSIGGGCTYRLPTERWRK